MPVIDAIFSAWMNVALCWLLLSLAGWQPWCCCGCTVTCNNCVSGKGPCRWEVVFDGFVNDNCTGCSDINGTWLIDHYLSGCAWDYFIIDDTVFPNLQSRSGGGCVDWPSGGTGSPGTLWSATIHVSVNSIPAIVVTISWVDPNASETHKFRDLSPPLSGGFVTCTSISGRSIPWWLEEEFPVSGGLACDSQATGTCTLTALPD